MSEAVAFARKHTRPGRVCLLSSAAPSYNLYKNYPQRGDDFRQAVLAAD
jgi:UDP-N-acetylmuramoylalanine-D-glutamate ligase